MITLAILVILALILVAACCVLFYFWGRIGEVLKQIFGTSNLQQINEDGRRSSSGTPKSVSSMTSLCLPRIQADFPEFNWPEYRNKCANVLTASLLARSEHNLSYLTGVEGDIVTQVSLAIKEDNLAGERHFYRDIEVHKTEITDYRKRDGLCIIMTQSAVGHTRWCEKDGVLVSGDKDYPDQTKYDMNLVYVQDESKVPVGEAALGLTCPNCGGVISSLGYKHCEYCGTAITPINIMVWRFGALREQDC